jgi:hypothetical protein
MPEQNSDDDCDNPGTNAGMAEDSVSPVVLPRMTLETLIDLTGQLEHLNEMVILRLEKAGGFTSTESYFSIVQPILDMLEIEIRIRYHAGMTCQELTLIVQDWIDREIREMKKTSREEDPFPSP